MGLCVAGLACALAFTASPAFAADTGKPSTIAGGNIVSVELLPEASTLRGANASQQFVVLGTLEDGRRKDLTSKSRWTLSSPSVARIEGQGRVFAVADGKTELIAEIAGHSAKSKLRIEGSSNKRPFSFARDIGGILTRRGCNGSGCHGGVKGQAGFKLSGSAVHPREDYRWIVEGGVYQVLSAESGGPKPPRVDLQNPEQSLLLTKPTMQVPHGGGLRFEQGSDDYQAILEWVRNGAPYGSGSDAGEPRLVRLEVLPKELFLRPGDGQQFVVAGYLSNGESEDFTHQVLYSSDQDVVADVGLDGRVEAKHPGEANVEIRAAGSTTTVRVGVVGETVVRYPDVPRRNFIDEHIFAKLRKFNIVPADLSGDAEFLRRVCLDLTGTLPPPERVREFLRDKDPNKRIRLIDILLDSPEYIDYWTFRFADLFRVAIFPVGNNPKWSRDYWQWIRQGIAGNAPYDQVARERIAAQGYNGPSRHYLPLAVIAPAQDMMMEQARVFFGRRFDCAQCHDHPYENWR